MATSVVHARLAVTVSLLALCIAAPALAQTAQDGPATEVDDIIVTAQKREESIQDVPIAVSAFTAENLDAMKIEGGSELMRAIPNVAFSKSNFSMYNFAIRGIGSKAISASSDPGVAVSFNNTPLIRNRLFEQEYLDVSRVEVLRGPQGTLYGRNATAGVVNMIPNLPGPDFEGMAKGETGTFGTLRGQVMMNLPVTDTFWVRAAGSFTQRDGFDYNQFNDTYINDRDLWSTRLSAAWEPSDRFRANLIWEHFEEDDQRSRTGKQLCTMDPGPDRVGSVAITDPLTRGRLSQGCLPGSLYEDAAFGTPNGLSMAQYYAAGMSIGYTTNVPSTRKQVFLVDTKVNPYEGVVQSRDFRKVSTIIDPVYRAKNDVYQLNIEFDFSDSLKFTSQTSYADDNYYSIQDYARNPSNEVFADSSNRFDVFRRPISSLVSPGGVYTDPQLGPSKRILSADLSQSDNRQFYQEFRLQSDFDGMFNFNVGANYLNFKTQDDYYVFNNLFSLIAEYFYNNDVTQQAKVSLVCDDSLTSKECVYVDPTSLDNLAGDGHNYFRSKNVVETESFGVFGEGYWDLNPELRLTLGLRYTRDEKTTTPYPSQLLLGSWPTLGFGPATGGSVRRGYYALDDIEQKWGAVTGRAVLDWKPREDTLIYASYARGYKGGGANPPRADINPIVVQYQPLAETFDPEYVNAFEIGAKNSFYDGRLRLNATAFYYDYTDYQVSQIVDRISLNENFDAKSMGLELEAVYRPTPNFRIDANLGYLRTRIGDGESSIDVMNRTQGNEDWMVIRPWLQVPSNCIAPKKHVEAILGHPKIVQEGTVFPLAALCSGSLRYGTFTEGMDSSTKFWEIFGIKYNPLLEAPNGGRGFEADLSGNELPNAPKLTANIGAQYSFDVNNWNVTVRGDYYRQSSSYFRVYNTDYDKLKGWGNVNLSASAEDYSRGIVLGIYVKNLFNESPIVDAFTNSDDSMLTTNIFTLDPRIVGFNVRKTF